MMLLATTIEGVSIGWLAVCVLIMAVGAALQSIIGIGLGLVAAPLLGLIDPGFVPAALVLAVVPLTVGMAYRERDAIHMTKIWWAVLGRVPGVIGGAWLAATGGQQAIVIVVGVSVLLAVGASISGVRFVPTPVNLFLAGTASGFGATVASIGGPPMALTYQHVAPATMRANLAAYFVIGGAMSITGLIVSGVLGAHEFRLGLLLTPGVFVGLSTARFTTARMPDHRIRTAVLLACAASAIALLLRELL